MRTEEPAIGSKSSGEDRFSEKLGRPTKGGSKNSIAVSSVNEQSKGPQKPTYADVLKSAIIRQKTGDVPQVRTVKCLSPIPDTSGVASSSEGEISSWDSSDNDIQPEFEKEKCPEK